MNDYFEKNDNQYLIKKINKEIINLGEVEDRIIKVLDEKVRPAVAKDGGDIKFKSFKDGVVHVELQGSCSGVQVHYDFKARSSKFTLSLCEEVKSVEAI